MKSKLALSLVAACGLSLMPALSYAGANGQGEERSDRSEKVRTITGCLEKQGDDYELRSDNGSTWELKGDAVNLSDHVGQTVRVTGTVDHAKMHGAKEKAKEKTEDNPSEHGHLTVTNLKTVGHGCNR
jgi:Protein of unknown function (DUF5818)